MKIMSPIRIFPRAIFTLFILLEIIQLIQNVHLCGKIAGKKVKVQNKYVYAYLGIPYAAPPVGNLRFQKPYPAEYRNTLYNATRLPPSCIQDSSIFTLVDINSEQKENSEDCLHLNIWVPTVNEEGKPFATMVWIHGGSFIVGSSNEDIYDGALLASIGNVIVASFNYRLNAFGYSNFGTQEAPGNMGMLDQVMAMQWIHRNIDSFGGDNNLITIFGESAGAISIAHHLISPLTKGLFKRAILQSGSNYHQYFAVSPEFNINATTLLSKEVGCDGIDVLKCMKSMDASKILSTEMRWLKRKQIVLLFHPQVGPPYLPKNPFHEIDTGKFHDVDVMIGEVMDEGSVFVLLFNPQLAAQDPPIFSKDSAVDLLSNVFEIKKRDANEIANAYLGNTSEINSSEILRQTIKVIGDSIFVCPSSHLTQRLSEHDRKVYRYRFNHTRIKSAFPKWVGVPHGEDLPFVFGRPFKEIEEFTAEEKEFSKNIIQLWTSFAKTGKPTYDGFQREWKTFDKKNRNSLSITLGNIHPVKAEIEEKCDFWNDINGHSTQKMSID